MGSLIRLALFGVVVVAALGVAMILASESGEVVVLRTSDPPNAEKTTRLWIVDDDAVPWLRSGAPTSAWLVRLRVNPNVELERDGEIHPFVARPVDDPEVRDWINHRMAEKYGWADWLIGLAADRSQAVPIRLDPR